VRKELAILGREASPFGETIGPRRELRVFGDHAEPFLIGEDHVALDVPPLIELAFELVDPLLRGMVRRVRAAGHVVDEERFVGIDLTQVLHVPNGVIRHSGDEVPRRLPGVRRDGRGVAKQVGLPLTGVASVERSIRSAAT
jgi:hypothetical protein